MRWVLLFLVACGKHGAALQFVDVKEDDLVIGVEVTGELAAVDSTDVKPPGLPDIWDYKIAQLADEGIDVAVGAPLVTFDASKQIQDLETMTNEADAAQKKLDKKRDDAQLARRDEELKIAEAEATLRKASLKATVPPDLSASVDLEVLKLEEQSAKLALDQAKNKSEKARRADAAELASLTEHHTYAVHRVEELQRNIGRMAETATRAGTVVYPSNWKGEKKKVGDNAWRMENVLQVVALGKMIGNGQVDEVEMAKVADKQPVRLRLDALPDVQLLGTVQSIAKNVQSKSSVDPSKVVHLKVELAPTADTPLRPGMRFRGEIETQRLAKVVQVPTEAVFVTADGPVAYRQKGGDVERVALTLGKRSATMVQVVSGLLPGDRVSRIDPVGP